MQRFIAILLLFLAAISDAFPSVLPDSISDNNPTSVPDDLTSGTATAITTNNLPSETATAIFPDSLPSVTADSVAVKKPKGILAQWWASLVNGNRDMTFEKKADISFVLVPLYSKESSFGIGGQLSSLYRLDRTDSIMQPSDLTFKCGYTINGTYNLGLQGHINWTRSHRMNYIFEYQSQSRHFWGIDFNSCVNNPATDVRFNRINVCADYEQRFAGNWFWGAAVRMKYGDIKLDKKEYLLGQPSRGFYSGLGISLVYDTRDFILNAKKGVLFMFRHIYYPSKLGENDSDIGYTTLQFNAYHRLWKDAVMAYDFFSETNISNGELPWQLREQICYDDCRMRGYYSGSYIDNNQICVQAELRQRVYKRLGCVAWVGAGTFFKTFETFDNRQILPNYGAGVRFEMKKNTNLRVDFGFGRGTSSIIFNFGEAF